MYEPIPVKDLLVSYQIIKNPRFETGLSDSEIGELAADIEERGILNDLVAQRFLVPEGEGGDGQKFVTVLLDGQRRKLAIERLIKEGRRDDDDVVVKFLYGADPIPYTDEAAVKAMLDALAIGQRRQGLSSFEQAMHANHLRSKGATNEAIGSAIERSATWVSRMLSAAQNATPELAEQWRKGVLPDEQVKDLAKITDREKQLEALKDTLKTRESGDRASRGAARANVKAEAAKASPPPAARAVQKPGAGEAASTPPPDDRPPHQPQSKAAIAEFAAMRRDFPARDPYMKGFLDAAAVIGGYVAFTDLPKDLNRYLNDVSNRKAKKQAAEKVKAPKPASKAKAKKAVAKAPKKSNGKR